MSNENICYIYLDKLSDVDTEFKIDDLIFSADARALRDSIVAAKGGSCAPCFFINGARGSGKSTFLKAVVKDLTEGENPHFVKLLDVDPTQLGDNEHFFMYFIGEILRYINRGASDGERKDCDHGSERDKCMRKIRKSLSFMAAGLVSLAKPLGENSETLDPAVMLETGMERCISSAGLRDYFREIMESLHSLYGPQEFLVTIDDSDMNSGKCYEIIECIRKYMLHERLIFVFSGDIKLYSMVIRGHQMNHFTKEAWEYDTPNKDARLNMLTLIGSQYMLKMFPVDNRLHLPNLKEMLSVGGRVYIVKCKEEDDEPGIPIQILLRKILGPAIGDDVMPLWEPVFHSLPLRSFLHMIKCYVKLLSSPNILCCNLGRLSCESILQTFSSILFSEGIDYDSIHNGSLFTLLSTVIRYECNPGTAGLLEKGYSTQYTLIQQICSLYLNAEIARQTVTLSRKLLWFGSLYPYLDARRAVGDAASPQMPETILQNGGYMDSLKSLFNKEVNIYAQWGADVTAMMACRKASHGQCINAVVHIPHRIGELIFTNDIVSSEDFRYEAALRNSISTLSHGTEKEYYLSVFNLVAVMVNCLEIVRNTAPGWDEAKKLGALESVLGSSALPANSSRLAERRGNEDVRDSDFSEHDTAPQVRWKQYEGPLSTTQHNLTSRLAERVYQWAEKWAEKQSFTHANSYTSIWNQYHAQDRAYEPELLQEYHKPDVTKTIEGFMRFYEELEMFSKLLLLFDMGGSAYSYEIGNESPLLTFPLIKDLRKLSEFGEQFFSQYERFLKS